MAKKYTLRQEPEEAEPFMEPTEAEKVVQHFGADKDEQVTPEQLADKLYEARAALESAKQIEAYWAKRAKETWPEDFSGMIGQCWVDVKSIAKKGSVDWDKYVWDQMEVRRADIPEKYLKTGTTYTKISVKKAKN